MDRVQVLTRGRWRLVHTTGHPDLLVVVNAAQPDSEAMLKKWGPAVDEPMKELEARRMVTQSSGHVMPMLDSGRIDEYDEELDETHTHEWFVMPLGQPLDRYLVDRRIPRDERLDILLQAATGILELHRDGLLHKDFKPSNLIKLPDRWVVSDLGESRAVGSHEVSMGTTIDSRRLTFDYAAPEQLARRTSTTATDAFSFAVTAIEVLTGLRAGFVRLGETPAASGSARLDDLLQRTVRNSPANRPSMHALSVAIARALGRESWAFENARLLTAASSWREMSRELAMARTATMAQQAWQLLVKGADGVDTSSQEQTYTASFPNRVNAALTIEDRPWRQIGASTVYWSATIRFVHNVRIPGHAHHQHFGLSESLWFLHTEPSRIDNRHSGGRDRLFAYQFSGDYRRNQHSPYGLRPDDPSVQEHLDGENGLRHTRAFIPGGDPSALAEHWSRLLTEAQSEARRKLSTASWYTDQRRADGPNSGLWHE